jgi:hypothetical protein
VLALVLKLTLAPALVAVATVVARRLGHRAGGLVGGLPVVAGPIVLIYAVEQGEPFAAEAAAGGVLGIISLALFCLAYAACARRGGVGVALAAGWGAFAASTAALSPVDPPLAVSALATLTAIAAGTALLRRAAAGHPAAGVSAELLPWRLGITAVLVVALTAAANDLSAHLAGLLAPFPIITAVLAGFTHAHAGPDAAIELLGGLVSALVCFLAFFTVLAATLDQTSAVAAFGLATASALALWALLVATVRNRPRRRSSGSTPSPTR